MKEQSSNGRQSSLPACREHHHSTGLAQDGPTVLHEDVVGSQGSEGLFPTRVVSRLGSYSSALCGEMGAGSAALPISGLYESTNPFKTLW